MSSFEFRPPVVDKPKEPLCLEVADGEEGRIELLCFRVTLRATSKNEDWA
jgi:hypothetical protein